MMRSAASGRCRGGLLASSAMGVALALSMVAVGGASAAPSKGPKKASPSGSVVVAVRAPAGVAAYARVGGVVVAKPARGVKVTRTVRRRAGVVQVSARPVTRRGVVFVPVVSRSRVRVVAGKRVAVSVRYRAVPGTRNLGVTGVTAARVNLAFTRPKGMAVRVRRAVGRVAPTSVNGGTAVAVSGNRVADRRVKAGTTYSYAVFSRVGGRWAPPVTVTVGTPQGAKEAAYVAPPSTTIIPAGKKVTTAERDGGVEVTLPSGIATPVLGAGFVLPVSERLPQGFLGTVSWISPDGRSVRLVPAGIADAFDYYHVDARVTGEPVELRQTNERSSTAGRRSHAMKPATCKGSGSGLGIKWDITPSGWFSGTVTTKSVWAASVPTGATFDVGGKLQVDATVEAAVSRGVECSLSFGNISLQLVAAPVPIVMVFEPSVKLRANGALTVSGYGYRVAAGAWTKGQIGTTNSIDAGLIRESQPLIGTVGASGNVGLSINGTLSIGPGGSAGGSGATAAIAGKITPLDTSVDVKIDPANPRGCANLDAKATAALGVNARAWLGSWSVNRSWWPSQLNATHTYGNWKYPTGTGCLSGGSSTGGGGGGTTTTPGGGGTGGGVSLNQYANTIVQWDGDTNPQKSAWLVGSDLKRRWIPDTATYQCLKNRGVAGPTALPASILDRLPDQNGQDGKPLDHAMCSDRPPVDQTEIVQVAAGYLHTCALREGGTVSCWGSNNFGQLGDGSTTDRLTPVVVSGLTDAIQVTAGIYHTCALRAGGSVVCWGYNGAGRLGDGSTTDRLTPVVVSGLTDAIQVTANNRHTCALREGGTVSCWGSNNFGQLGDGSTTDRLTPVVVLELSDVVQVAVGYYYGCALRADGTVACWGNNSDGELGDGTVTRRLTPVNVPGLTDATQLTANGNEPIWAVGSHTCVLRVNGIVLCWGWNRFGQLGDGTTLGQVTPVVVSGLSDAVQVAAGVHHTCALREGGAVACWGPNDDGRLGDGTTETSLIPIETSGLTDASQITAGAGHTCALRAGGVVVCWGNNGWGQLGDGSTTNRLTPTPVVGL